MVGIVVTEIVGLDSTVFDRFRAAFEDTAVLSRRWESCCSSIFIFSTMALYLDGSLFAGAMP